MTIIDTWWNRLQRSRERKQPYQVLLISSGQDLEEQVLEALDKSHIYQVSLVHIDTIDLVPANYEIVMVLGALEKDKLQYFADQARLAGQQFYHIGDTLFLEDLISVPQRIGPLMALKYKASPLDGRWRVLKRAADVF